MSTYSVIGKSFPRLDAAQKARGEAVYISDIKLEGMLYGKIFRSPFPHARILSIDASSAKKLPGVKAVITAADTPRKPFCINLAWANKLPLQDDKVRYIGDEVAAVAAISEEVAQEALELIRVEYSELPAVFEIDEAIAPGAPLIHTEVRNMAASFSREFGDVGKGFREAHLIVEDEFETQPAAHLCMEPRACVAAYDGYRLAVWATTQTPHPLRYELAQALDIPISRIKVIDKFVGGGFGSRMGVDAIEIVSSLMAMKTGRPVRIVNSREEEFETSRCRYPMRIRLKTGCRKDGRIIAREGIFYTDNGAYNGHGIAITGNACAKLCQLYAPPNVRFEGYVVYTNKLWGGAFRGYGGPQTHFAMESQMDIIAEKLNMDPMELRLINANVAGQTAASGHKIVSCGMSECIKKAADEAGYQRRGDLPANRGIGMSAMIHGGGGVKYYYGQNSNYSDAFIKLNCGGKVDLLIGSTDHGQGAYTILAQIAAEELGARVEDVNVVAGDTDATPPCLGLWGSRQTFAAGNAVRNAAVEAKRALLEAVADRLEASPAELDIKDGSVFVKEHPENNITFDDAVKYSYEVKGRPLAGRGYYDDPISEPVDPSTGYGNPCPTYTFACHVAEVEVNPRTGEVKVLKLVAAHDVGRAINPVSVEGQIEGGVAQGIGYGLMEEIVWDYGRVVNGSVIDYKVPSAPDMPVIVPIIVETDDPYGPFGAKGVGEPGLVPTAPAIANAIYAAVGVRIKSLPITPEKVLAALKSKGR